MSFTIGSLFDGSGGFPLATTMCGGTPKWASEVEPYPIAVTKSRFPNVKHLGSVTDIKGGEVEPVDVITFGSPCQDLSVAGKRAGLKHEANGDDETTRSGLFMEAVRIIKEMREATNGVYPRFALWENVPGAFSSNKGEDFRIVLEELIKIVEPTAVMPPVPKAGWPYSDSHCGDGWSLAYRVLDAQFWGVPQRRRRIYLVADFRGECAGKVSFEREGLRGYFETGRTPWQAAPGDAEAGSGAADCEGVGLDIYNLAVTGEVAASLTTATGQGASNTGPSVCVPYTLKIRSGCEGGGKGALIQTDMSATLATNNDQYLFQPICFEPGAASRLGGYCYEDQAGTLRATMGDNQFAVAYTLKEQHLFENHAQDARYKGPLEVSPMLPAQLGTGGNNQPLVVESHPVKCYDIGEARLRTPSEYEEVCPTLTARCGTGGNNLQGGGATSQNSQGMGHKANTSYTLNTTDVHGVAYLASGKGTVGTLMVNAGTKLWSGNQESLSGDYSIIEERGVPIRYIVRRLTPTECARLQGFPDAWGHPDVKTELTDEEYQFWLNVRNTHAAINDKPTKEYTKDQILKWYNGLHTDSSEYKMWGNGIALPNALYMMQGIADVMSEEKAARRKWLKDLLGDCL